jgi:hypothetical protein
MIASLRRAAWLGSLCLVLQSCAMTGGGDGPPSVVALPNGYYLQRSDGQRDKASSIDLVKRGGGPVVRGPIAAYDVDGNLVVGCVGKWPERGFSYSNEAPFPDSPDAKYFILDTTNGRLEGGLDPASWRTRLKALGAPESLEITAPALPP